MVCIKPEMHIITMSREVPPASRQRRLHSASFKSDLIARTLEPGASVSAIALENGLNTNLLFAWRRKHLRSLAGSGKPALAAATPVMLPVQITPAEAQAPASPKPHKAHASSGTIEIDVGGACVRVRGSVDEESLRCVMRVLKAPQP